MSTEVLYTERDADSDGIELVDCDEACRVIGGKKRPINRATLYKGIKAGKYPRPVHPGPGTSRWIKRELTDCVRAFIAERDGGKAA